MNRRLSKRINQQTIDIFLEWLSSVITLQEGETIERKNYKQYVPHNAYYYDKFTLKNSLFTPRWIKRKLKLKLRDNPTKPIEDYRMADFK